MKYNWKDLPKPLSCFTVRSATMTDLSSGKIIQHYSANTKLVMAQKCVTSEGTFYRTASAKQHSLNWAFGASALGLPNDKAPSAPSAPKSLKKTVSRPKPVSRTPAPVRKQKSVQNTPKPNGGEAKGFRGLLKRIFRRKNG